MRIEDLDVTRVRPGAAEQALQILEWLGLDYDARPYHQTFDLNPYRQVMRTLTDSGLAYECSLTRSQIRQAVSAPHRGDQELRYPPHLRPTDRSAFRFDRENANYRMVVPDETIAIDDQIAGSHQFRPCDETGDFVIWTKLGVPAYQLAVVVDDARQGVTDVVRGDDLLSSAARQTLLYRALGLAPPRWWHVPLVLGPDGRRLAKRHGDTHVDHYRQAGVRPQRVIGLLAHWCGVGNPGGPPVEMSAEDFRATFNADTLPRCPIRFTAQDHDWLLGRS